SARRLSSALSSEDLPTFDRPTTAISGRPPPGQSPPALLFTNSAERIFIVLAPFGALLYHPPVAKSNRRRTRWLLIAIVLFGLPLGALSLYWLLTLPDVAALA